MTLSVLGCGWLGLPLAAYFAAKKDRVSGSTTSLEKLPRLQSLGIVPYLIDLADPDDRTLDNFCASDYLIIAHPPKDRQNAYPEAIQHLLAHTPGSTVVILISSTSVYPNSDGEVDETTPVTFENTPRPHILKAEETVRTFSSKHLILRCAGLMGYDRLGVRYFQDKTVPAADTPVNQVHRDDVIEAIAALIRSNVFGTYNLCAPKHPTKKKLYAREAEVTGLICPEFEPGIEKSKVVDGGKVCRDTGFAYRYPDPMRFAQASGG